MVTSCLLFVVAVASASVFAAEVATQPKIFGLDFKKEKRESTGSLTRRQNAFAADISNEQIFYQVDVEIGSDGQKFGLQLDTGSSDLWVPLAGSRVCPDSQSCSLGSYNPDSSKSFNILDNEPDFSISYVDGSEIIGVYFTDVLTMGTTSIKKMQMGLAQDSPSRDFGIMGIGFQSGESIAQDDPRAKYPNIVNQLKNQGFIKTLAYSLWLNDLESNQGSILFGGVDTEKYHGDLTVLPIQPDTRTGDISSMTVVLAGVSLNNKAGKSQYSKANINIPVILDCGSTDTYLPDDIVQPILNGVGAVADSDLGFVVPCSLGRDGATFSFTFGASGGPVITVDISEFVRPIPEAVGEYTFSDDTPACIWGLQPAGQRPNLFGDTFIRSAYVVYDLESQEIAIAQTNFNTTKSNILEFSNQVIPNAKATASGAAVTQTYSGIPGVATQVGKPASGATQVGSGPPKPTFDLGGKGAASGLKAPGIEVSTMVAGAVVLMSLVFGSSIFRAM